MLRGNNKVSVKNSSFYHRFASHTYVMGRPEFVDISILYAIINFIGTFAVLKLFDTGGLGDRGGRARPELSPGKDGGA